MTDNAPRRNTNAEMVTVITAHARGEVIESRRTLTETHDRYAHLKQWAVDESPEFNFAIRQYRVKPAEPLRFFVAVVGESACWGSRDRARVADWIRRRPNPSRFSVIEVVEVQAD